MSGITVQDFVNARLYANEEEVIQEALRYLLQNRPELRIALAVHRYQTEDISLGRAAELAGVNTLSMRDILVSRGVTLRLGPATLEEARAEAAIALQLLNDDAD